MGELGGTSARERAVVYWRAGEPHVRLPDPRRLTPTTALAALRAYVWARDERRKGCRGTRRSGGEQRP